MASTHSHPGGDHADHAHAGHDHGGGDSGGHAGHGHAGHSHAPASFGRAFAIGITLNLVYVAVEAVFEAIRSVRSSGVSVLLIEQNAHRSLGVADYAYVLDRGRVTFEGAPSVLDDPKRLEEAYFGAAAHAAG